MSAPEWLVVGARVASVSRGREGYTSVRRARVLRVGKRDVVLDNEERFYAATLERRTRGEWSLGATKLVAADDSVVAEAIAEIRERNAIQAARNACHNFSLGGSARGTSLTAADVILALAPLTGVADEIAGLFERGRRP